MKNHFQRLGRFIPVIFFSFLSQGCSSLSKLFQNKEQTIYQEAVAKCMAQSLTVTISNQLKFIDNVIRDDSIIRSSMENEDGRHKGDSLIKEFKNLRKEASNTYDRLNTRLYWTRDVLECYRSISDPDSLSFADTLAPTKGYKDIQSYICSLWDFCRVPRLKNDANYRGTFDNDLMTLATTYIDSITFQSKFSGEYGTHAPDASFIEYALIHLASDRKYPAKSDAIYRIGEKSNLLQSFEDKTGDCDVQSIWLWYYLEALRTKYHCFQGLQFHIEGVYLTKSGIYVSEEPYNHAVLTISFRGKDGKLHTKRIDPVNMRN